MTRLDAIRKGAEAARSTLHKLCLAPATFHMSIPVEPTDTDVVLGSALADIPYLLELVRELREALSGKTDDEPTCEHQQEWTWWLESKCRFYCSQCFRRALARCDELEEG